MIYADDAKVIVALKKMHSELQQENRLEDNLVTLIKNMAEAEVDPVLGIEVPNFDETINKMNDIQDAILWGDDE